MNLEAIFGSDVFKWVVLPSLILLARVLDVTLQTIRIVFVSRGLKYLAPAIGFFEVLIWLFAIRVIMQNLNNVACYISYGAGFALGTFIGIQIEKRLAIGRSVLRIITKRDASELIAHLREKGYGVTSLDAQGSEGTVHIIFMIIRRSDFECLTEIIRKFNPKAFYTAEDVRFASEGIFPTKKTQLSMNNFSYLLRYWRKGK